MRLSQELLLLSAPSVVLCFSNVLDKYLQLSSCVKEIYEKHFIPNANILVSLSIQDDVFESSRTFNQYASVTVKMFVDNLIEELHTLSTYSITVTSPKSVIVKMWDCKLGNVSYVLLCRWTNTNSSKCVHDQIQVLHLMNCLNRRANFLFVVVTDGDIVESQSVVRDILEELWKWRILNAVVLLSNLSSSPGTNSVTFDIYTWFPYQGIEQCTQVQKVFKINSCTSNGLLSNLPLFPSKIPKTVKGCPITAAIVVTPLIAEAPRIILGKNGTSKPHFDKGWEIKIWKILVEKMNLTEEYIESNFRFALNSTSAGIKQLILSLRADVGFGSWPLLWRNIKIFDASSSLHRIEFVWLVPCAQVHPLWTGMFRIFDIYVWIAGTVMSFTTAFIFSYISKCSGEIGRFSNYHQCLLSLWGMLLGISLSILPIRTHVRLVYLAWMVFCLSINTVFQTYFTSFMIQRVHQHQISSFDEILNSKIEFGYPEGIGEIFRFSDDPKTIKMKQKRKLCQDIKTCLSRVAYKRDYCLLYSRRLIDFDLTHKYLDEKGDPLICMVKETFFSGLGTIYFQKGHPLFDRFDLLINRIIEGGFYDFMVRRDMEKAKVRAAVRFVHSVAFEYSVLKLQNLQAVVFMLLIGQLASFVTFLGELICSRCHVT
ncbi:Ionotropic receptor 222 [Blattella germanica]|nr:Ionotropic receptor 222 [Blattella germanica]